MAEITEKTVTTQDTGNFQVESVSTEKDATSFQTTQYLVYFFFAALDILLVFRLVLKMLGASVSSNFVGFIYGITNIFIAPFEGIFRSGYTQGAETTAVIEPATIIAILVYAVLAWGIVKLVQVLSGKKQTE